MQDINREGIRGVYVSCDGKCAAISRNMRFLRDTHGHVASPYTRKTLKLLRFVLACFTHNAGVEGSSPSLSTTKSII